jgi:hypothetical protein
MPYDFVDSWLGQACLAHTLNRLNHEARPICYVPFFGGEVLPP